MGAHFHRLLDVLLPRGGGLIAMFEGYFDESGDFDKPPGVFCVAGYYLDSDTAKEMDREWRAVLLEHEIPYFHMVDCAHENGVFKNLAEGEADVIARKMISLIKQHTLNGFAVIAKAEAFAPTDKNPDEYSTCVDHCVGAFKSFLEVSRVTGDIAYFFETGHKNRGRAYNHVAHRIAGNDSLTFAGKEQVPLLQAADLLAWQCTKYVKDRFRGKGPRKDFLALMEHRHLLAYISPGEGGGKMLFEAWPLSERVQNNTEMRIDNDAPVTFLYEDGEDIPIIPVGQSHGWRMGGGRMAIVKFSDLGKKDFALGFDDARLREAIWFLIGAMGLYADKGNGLLIPADKISLDIQDKEAVLSIQTPNGGLIGFHIPEETLSGFKEYLKGKLDSYE